MFDPMFMNPPARPFDLFGLPLVVVVLGLAIFGLIVGAIWVRRIMSGDDNNGDWWRFRR